MSALADWVAVISWNGAESCAEGVLAETMRPLTAACSADALAAAVRCVKLRGDTALPFPLAAAEARVVVIQIVEKEWKSSRN